MHRKTVFLKRSKIRSGAAQTRCMKKAVTADEAMHGVECTARRHVRCGGSFPEKQKEPHRNAVPVSLSGFYAPILLSLHVNWLLCLAALFL